jgi:predicted nucleotidyltransferase
MTVGDPTLAAIVRVLKDKFMCHSVLLYGSRARGQITPTSDYDVIGIRKSGERTRIAKKVKGKFWDVFVYAEKDLKKLGDQHLSWKHAQVLYSKGPYGKQLLQRIETLLKKPFKRHPVSEVSAIKAWAQKELERCRMKDIQGLYRRAEFQYALIEHYFLVRQKRFWGPKESFEWLKNNDPKTFQLILSSLKAPANLSHLKAAASRVYNVKLD